MAGLKACIQKAGKALSKSDAAAIVQIHDTLIGNGVKAEAAERTAVAHYLEQLRTEALALRDEIAAKGGDVTPLFRDIQDFLAQKVEAPPPEVPRETPPPPPGPDPVVMAQAEYGVAASAVAALGEAPPVPASEEKHFGQLGRAGASPEAVAAYDAAVINRQLWETAYAPLKAAEQVAANRLKALAGMAPEGDIQANAQPTDNASPTGLPGGAALEGIPAAQVRDAETGGDVAAGTAGGGATDTTGTATVGGRGAGPESGVGDGQGPVPVPASGETTGGVPGVGGVPGAEGAGTDAGERERRLSVGSDYVITDADQLGKGGFKTKFRQNVDAITLAKRIRAESRSATPEEQAILVKYVGWGGMPQAFDQNNAKWSAEYEELRNALTDEEWRAARASTPNAHYTSPTVVRGIYAGLARMGFQKGRVLEPSAGVGHFLGLGPRGIKWTAVELDPISAQIAQLLYPNARVNNSGFQDIDMPNDFFDAAIGNPPFGSEKLYDSRHKELKGFSIHNFFFAKSIAKLRPGGVLAMVVSNSMLDKTGGKERAHFAKDVKLLGAIRLPNNAFKENAGTEVTTDILFLQKRAEGDTEKGPAWSAVGSIETPSGESIPLNEYFIAHPDMMLGDMTLEGTMYRDKSPALIARPNADLAADLAQAMARLPADVYQARKGAEIETPPIAPADVPAGTKVYSYFAHGEQAIAQRIPDLAGETQAIVAHVGSTKVARMKGMIGVRNALSDLMEAELTNAPAKDLKTKRALLNKLFDAFVKKHGAIHTPANRQLMRDDPDFPRILALENDYEGPISKDVAKKRGIAPREATFKKADIFKKRVLVPRPPVTHVDTAQDGLFVSMNERGTVDLPFIAELTGKSADAVTAELAGKIFRDPASGDWVLADQYLYGNVKRKLAEARAANLPENVAALEAVQPPDKAPTDIKVGLGAPWLPPADIQAFVKHLLGAESKIVHAVGVWTANIGGATNLKNSVEWGTPDMPASKIIPALLQGKAIVVRREDRNGNSFVDKDATIAATLKAEAIKREFNDAAGNGWLWTDPARRDRLAALFNAKFNTHRTRDHYDGSYLTLPGFSEAHKPHPHVTNAVARALQEGRMLADHAVGAGKAEPLDAKVLTPDGWTRMGDLQVGDLVIAGDGSPTCVEGVYPQGNKEIFRVTFSDGSSTECCDEHLWLTHTYAERMAAAKAKTLGKDWPSATPHVRSLAEIRETLRAPHLNAKNHSIPMVGVVQFNARPIPLNPYVMGVMLGDGCFRGKTPTLSSADPEILSAVSALLPDGMEMRHWSGYDYALVHTTRVAVNAVTQVLRTTALWGAMSHEKHVPAEYLYNTAEVRLAVLQGLMDTDGWVQRTSACFATSSPQLADDVTALVESFGGVVRRREKTPKYTYQGVRRIGRQAFLLTLRLPPGVIPFRLPRKAEAYMPATKYQPIRYIVSVEPVGAKPAQCIRVAHPSHLYVTDRFIVTHNTWFGIISAMEMRRLGLAKKPLFVVPNHLVGQWGAEFYKIYPSAKVLVATKKDFEAENRRVLMSRIATGDWDAVVVGHSQFKMLPLPPAEEKAFIQDQVAEIVAAMEAMKGADDKGSRAVKQLEKRKTNLEERMKRLADKAVDDTVNFGELGVDALFVDEAHDFKNLFFATQMTGVAGLGDTAGSQKAFDMFIKARMIQKGNNEKGTFWLTGTPISNTMAEMFTVQRYSQYKELADLGLHHFDAWANTFGNLQADWELDAGGRYKMKTRFRQFKNMHQLQAMYRSFADVMLERDLKKMAAERGEKWPVPKLVGGKVQQKVIPRSPAQADYMASIIRRMENMPADKRLDNHLNATNDARKMALDMRLVTSYADEEAGNKAHVVAADVHRMYQKWNADKGTILVFIDLSTPKQFQSAEAKRIQDLVKRAEAGDEEAAEELGKVSMDELLAANSQFDVYNDIKAKLIAKGIPENEVRFIHEGTTEDKLAKLHADVRSGRVRVLLGSTQKMGTGMNVQNRLVGLINVDAPWRPADIEQRIGRIIRQGNELYRRDPEGFEVEVINMATEKTYDARMWEILQQKQEIIEQARNGTAGDVIDDIAVSAATFAEMKAAATGNPLIQEQVKLATAVRTLQVEVAEENRKRHSAEREIEYEKTTDQRAAAARAEVAKGKPVRDAAKAGPWSVTVGSKDFREEPVPADPEQAKLVEKANAEQKKAALVAIAAQLPQAMAVAKAAERHNTPFIRYRGIQTELYESFGFGVKAETPGLKFDAYYSGGDKFSASGLLTRIDNWLERADADAEAQIAAQAAQEHRRADEARTLLRDQSASKAGDLKATQARLDAVMSELQRMEDPLYVPLHERKPGEAFDEKGHRLPDDEYTNAVFMENPATVTEGEGEPEEITGMPQSGQRVVDLAAQMAARFAEPGPLARERATPTELERGIPLDTMSLTRFADAELAAAQTRFAHQLAATPLPVLEQQYATLSGTMGGKLLDVDEMRMLSSDYAANRNYAPATHEPASAAIKAMYQQRLAQTQGQPGWVYITVGGPGAGKSTGIELRPDLAQRAELLYATMGTSEGSISAKIQMALDAGKQVFIEYVHRPVADAYVRGVVPRALQQLQNFGSARMVPLEPAVRSHVASNATIRQVAQRFAGDPNVKLLVVLNDRGFGEARIGELAQVPEIRYDSAVAEAQAALRRLKDDGTLDQETFQLFSSGAQPVARRDEGAREGTFAGVRGRAQQERQGEETHPVAPQSGQYLQGRLRSGLTVKRVQSIVAQLPIHAGITFNVVDEQSQPNWAGSYDLKTNTVTINAAAAQTERDVLLTAAHEVVGHIGALRTMGIEGWRRTVAGYRALSKVGGKRFDALVKEVRARYPGASEATEIAEFIALAAEHRFNEGPIGRFMRQVREFIQRGLTAMGFEHPFSMADIDAILTKGERYARTGEGARPIDDAPDAGAMQTAPAGGFDVVPEDWKEAFIRKVQDRYRPLLRHQQGIEAATGRPLPDAMNPYQKEELLHKRTSNQLEAFEKQYVAPLAKAMAKDGVSLEELDVYVYAKHAKERNARIASINPDMPDGGSGMTNAQADQILDLAKTTGRDAVLEPLAQRVYAINDARLQLLVARGMETQDTVDDWRSGEYEGARLPGEPDLSYRAYVPLKGGPNVETGRPRSGKGFDIRGKESLQALGRRTIADSPVLNSISQYEESVVRAEKLVVGRALLLMAMKHPNDDYWQVYPPGKTQKVRRFNRRTREVEIVSDNQMRNDPEMLAVKVDSKTWYIHLEDPRLRDAMKNLGPEPLNSLMKLLGKANRALAMLATSFNPEFILSNLPRDIQTAVFNLLAQEHMAGNRINGKALAKQVVKDIPRAVKAQYQGLRGTPIADPIMAQAFDEYQESGAGIGFFGLRDLEQHEADFDTLLKKAEGGIEGDLLTARDAIFQYVSDLNGAVENGVRFAAFMNARKAGLSLDQAGSLAKNLTVNFNRRGELGVLANTLYLFANASVQGSATVLKSMKSPFAQKLAAGIAAGAFLLAELNRLLGGDDDDDKAFWDKLPDYVKERNLVLMKPWAPGQYFTFPLPYGYSVFKVFGDVLNSMVHGAKSVPQGAMSLAAALMGSFNPIGLDTSESAAKAAVKTLAPTVLSPFVELAVNENFFGAPIYQENFPNGTPKPDSALGRRTTPEWSKKIAQWLNAATGGSEYMPGGVDITPEAIQHIARFVTGGAGATLDRAASTVWKLLKGELPPIREIPFLRRLEGEINPNVSLGEFYDRRDEIFQIRKQYSELTGPEQARFAQRYGEKLKLYGAAKGTDKFMRHQNEIRNQLYERTMSDADRERQIEAVEASKREKALQFNKAYNAAA